MLRQRVTFILCATRFASNLGSSARVLHNFGFQSLVLVLPECEVGAEARTFAMQGAWLLDKAPILPSLAAAAESVDFLIGTSARSFRRGPDTISAPQLVPDLIAPHHPRSMGIVLGSERNGLSSQELALCHWLVTIPTDSDHGSLNLAQAVAVLAYQAHVSLARGSSEPDDHPALPAAHWTTLMAQIEALLLEKPMPTTLSIKRIMKRISKMAGRARLDQQDTDLLLGLIKRIRKG